MKLAAILATFVMSTAAVAAAPAGAKPEVLPNLTAEQIKVYNKIARLIDLAPSRFQSVRGEVVETYDWGTVYLGEAFGDGRDGVVVEKKGTVTYDFTLFDGSLAAAEEIGKEWGALLDRIFAHWGQAKPAQYERLTVYAARAYQGLVVEVRINRSRNEKTAKVRVLVNATTNLQRE